MVLVIDASNIRSGGGKTHLIGILKYYDIKYGFNKIIVYSNQKTLDNLPEKTWLVKKSHKLLNKSFIWSFYFQIFIFSKLVKTKDKASIVFAPGGTFLGNFSPFVTMSRNMLPFEFNEAFRFKKWKVRIRFILLFFTQVFSYKRANGMIFLTEYAKKIVSKRIRKLMFNSVIIPHGIDESFSCKPRKQLKINDYSLNKPYKFLYVSVVNAYKHQWIVAEAILKLKEAGYPVCLELIGPSSPESIERLNKIIKSDRNKNNVINYIGSVSNNELSNHYISADAFVFASSCENLPNILIEAMTSGLPIASSNMGPMPEVLSEGGLYFNPLDIGSIYYCLKKIILEPKTREFIANKAYKKANTYTWKDCSSNTFNYIKKINNKFYEN